jgi:hypothetical protein
MPKNSESTLKISFMYDLKFLLKLSKITHNKIIGQHFVQVCCLGIDGQK